MTYYIKNNALRFYFTYIYGRQNILSAIGSDAFYDRYIKDSITTFIARRFEDIVRDYLMLQVRFGMINGVYNIGTYYYDDPINKTNGEFDVALEVDDGYDIVEVKYLKDEVDQKTIRKEIKQIKEIKEINVKNIGFASINGFMNGITGLKYKISGDDIYFKNKNRVI